MAKTEFIRAERITCIVDRGLASRAEEVLQGARGLVSEAGRAAVLRARRLQLNPGKPDRMEENPVQLFRFYVPYGQDRSTVEFLSREMGLDLPGRGTVFSERVQLSGLEPSVLRDGRFAGDSQSETAVQSHLAYICCILRRGEASNLAMSVLQMGLSAPVVTYGTGMGLRDKLGLLRITIPAEKEVLHLVVPQEDAQEAFDLITDAARLDQPGRGFIYMSLVRFGVTNKRIYIGETRHVASMEQVIAAIDTLKGTTYWRKKTVRPQGERRRGYLSDLKSYTIHGEEIRMEELVRSALKAGAGGATLSNLRVPTWAGDDGNYVSRARQSSDLIVPTSIIDAVHASVSKAVTEASAGDTVVVLSKVEKAGSYRHR